MRSNFDNPMKLDKDGVAEACGPLEWHGETEASVTVTITQDKVEGTASGSFSPPADEWMLEVRPSDPHKKFKKGQAHGQGELRAVPSAPAAEDPFPWGQDVDLDPKAPDET
jgi:hypothetical protein